MNPRYLLGTYAFQAYTFDHSDISPKCNGAGGIRTPGTLASSMVFETISFNHSDTAPYNPQGTPFYTSEGQGV